MRYSNAMPQLSKNAFNSNYSTELYTTQSFLLLGFLLAIFTSCYGDEKRKNMRGGNIS